MHSTVVFLNEDAMSAATLRLTTAGLLCLAIQSTYSAFVLNFDCNPYNARKWPSSNIEYRLSKSFLPQEVANIEEAFRQFETNTCLRFIETPRAIYDGIYFFRVTDERCRGTVGKQPRNVVYGYRRCWTKIGYILHEIMHNLGFRHEHQRPDRDQHIRLIPEHIQRDKMPFFHRIDDTLFYDTLNSTYDAYSVMHYEPTLFTAAENQVSMMPASDKWIAEEIGQKEHLSKGDIEAINKLYCS